MKRPIKEEYNEVYYYVTDLQKYCDELEKALDKACEELSIHTYTKHEFLGEHGMNKDDWKEWCLKDDE